LSEETSGELFRVQANPEQNIMFGVRGALILWSVTKINIKANEGDMTFL
jgi:hypothetical protein